MEAQEVVSDQQKKEMPGRRANVKSRPNQNDGDVNFTPVRYAWQSVSEPIVVINTRDAWVRFQLTARDLHALAKTGRIFRWRLNGRSLYLLHEVRAVAGGAR